MARGDGVTLAVIMTYIFIILLNIAWIGTLIWGIIYVLTHMNGWING